MNQDRCNTGQSQYWCHAIGHKLHFDGLCWGGGQGQLGIERGKEGGRVAVLPGRPVPRAAGLALVANRWPAVLSLQFVLPGSPASLVSVVHQLRVWKSFSKWATARNCAWFVSAGAKPSIDGGTSYTGRTLLLANDGRPRRLLHCLSVMMEGPSFHTKALHFITTLSRGVEMAFHRAAGS